MSDGIAAARIEQRGLYFEEFIEGALYVHAPGVPSRKPTTCCSRRSP